MTTLPPPEAYRAIASTYDATPNPLTALEHRTLAPLLPDLRNLFIADIAAGTGRWTHYFQSHGARTIGTDLCRDMLAYAPHPLAQADNIALPLRSDAFDLVLCSFAFGYEPDCFPELIRIARPGGQLIITDVHPHAIRRGWSRTFRVDGLLIEPEHHAYTLDDLRDPRLTLANLIEPHIAEPEREIFTRAGKPDAFTAATEHPAIFVVIWTKTSSTNK
jgi:ubiquinone/menaquinone biosynthesis C-methylase UbiE